ncbi:MAG: SBBP repeat-containing protein [Candidatus Poribacteria bacterium]|nr:SBBP repeat-containing protein [Candidatus Poribacteria bacterium]
MKTLALATIILVMGWCVCSAWSKVEYAPTVLDESSASQVLDATTRSAVFARLFQIPLHFVANHGQMDEAVIYYAKAENGTVYCTDQGLTFGFSEGSIRLTFSEGKRVKPDVRGELPGKVNYFIGNERQQWRENIPTFQEVVYRDVYPGIDLVYSGVQRRLKYTFYLQPGASVDQIEMNYEGVEAVSIDPDTDELILQMGWGTMKDAAPVAHQEIDGVKKPIDVSFRILGDTHIGFAMGAYDSNYMLVLDPGYSTYLGGSSHDIALDIAVDSSGNAYVMGATESTNFPTQGPFQGSHAGGDFDVFITKFNSSGSSLTYSTYLGGNDDDGAFPMAQLTTGIAIDSSGNAYVTGMTRSTNFPLQNEFQSTHAGGTEDIFVTKLNSSGNALLYSTYLGGNGLDHAHAIAVDSSGNAYVTGRTDSTSGMPTANGFQTTHSSGSSDDAFVAKLDTVTGGSSSVTYFTYLGGTGTDDGFGIAVDSSGNAYVTGVTGSTTGFPIQSAFQSTHDGGTIDGYLTKIDTTQTGAASLIYSTYFGGNGKDESRGIVLDNSGNVYLTGQTESTNFDLQNAFDSSLGGTSDAFLTKFDSSGQITASTFSTYFGGSGMDNGLSIDRDSSGNLYITGPTSSTDLPLQNAFQSTPGGNGDAFVTKFDSSGQLTASTYSTYLGGSSPDDGIGIAVNSSDAYIAGRTESSDFPLQNPFDNSLGGPEDGFVASYTSDGSLPVELAAFTATTADDIVTLKWRTITETNNLGFNIYRRQTPDGRFEKVNMVLIKGAGTDATPHDYQFVDPDVEPGGIYYYYLEDVDFNGAAERSDLLQVDLTGNRLRLHANGLPPETRLLQNYPNPFNPETWFPYELATAAPVSLGIYDVKGLLVRQLELGVREAGSYLSREAAAYWDGRDQWGSAVSSGLYSYTLTAGDFQSTRRMVILK